MTSITIELPDDLAERASQAGLLLSPALAELIAAAVERVSQDSQYFEQQIRESVAQANGSDAHWLTHDEVMSEWASERAALLSGKPSAATTP